MNKFISNLINLLFGKKMLSFSKGCRQINKIKGKHLIIEIIPIGHRFDCWKWVTLIKDADCLLHGVFIESINLFISPDAAKEHAKAFCKVNGCSCEFIIRN